MNYSALIATRLVSSECPYIVYSLTYWLISAAHDLDGARRLWKSELAKWRERGRESDAFIFEWRENGWTLCGSLYDSEAPDPAVLVANF